jgi:hypothetical protein
MGSFDGADCCELVAAFILNKINNEIGGNFGLYRDDGLGAIKDTARKIEIMKKKLCKLFDESGLRITVEANQKVVIYLDVTLDLSREQYSPYTKPNSRILYINRRSNHPPAVMNNISASINKRLSTNSSNQSAFENSAAPYKQALKDSGHDSNSVYNKPNSENSTKNNRRKRNITWFNPPWSLSVCTNVARKFLSLISTAFPKDHTLHPLFNRNTVKVSYSCMPNMKNIVENHNKNILAGSTSTITTPEERACNCRQPANCPLDGDCLRKSVIYQAAVTTQDNNTETYIGLTEGPFKTRYNNHTSTFRNESKRHSTELSSYIWRLKDQDTNFTIKWKIIRQARACKSGTGICGLCLTEKYYIMYKPDMATLNSRNELVSTCRHSRKYFLAHTSC